MVSMIGIFKKFIALPLVLILPFCCIPFKCILYIVHTFATQVLQCKEDRPLKKWLCKYLPFLPASLPTLLFCRLAELNVMLSGNKMLGPEAWEAFVQERITLTWMANDVKIIGEDFLTIIVTNSHPFLFRDCHRVLWPTGHTGDSFDTL